MAPKFLDLINLVAKELRYASGSNESNEKRSRRIEVLTNLLSSLSLAYHYYQEYIKLGVYHSTVEQEKEDGTT